MSPNKPMARIAYVSVCVAMLGLSSCAAEDYTQPIPDQQISPQEVQEGNQAVQAIGQGGADPAIDNGQATDDTDGLTATLAPEQIEPAVSESAADEAANVPDTAPADDTVETSRLTTTNETEIQPTQGTDPGTGTGVAELRPCRAASGYVNGRRHSICVTTVNGKLVGITTARAFVRMRAAARSAGRSLVIVSGFRTMAQQRYLYNLYLSGRGNLAARPGYSNHQSGIALDLNTSSGSNYAWLARNARRFGFVRTVPSEPWHWERRY